MPIDTDDVMRLADSFRHVASIASATMRPVISKAGLNLKNAMHDEVSGHPTYPKLPYSITYDITEHANVVDVEVGPRTSSEAQGLQGGLAFLYYGNSRNGPVLPDPVHLLDDEADATERWLGQALGDAL
jgi:hypothetical protein